MHRLIAYLAVWLSLWCTSALAQGDWIWPSYADADNIQVALGSYQTLEWSYNYKPFTLTIYQGPDADGAYAVQTLLANRSTETSYTWQVQPLEGRPVDQCFHAGLTSPDPSSGGSFDSTAFCGTTAALSSSTSTTATPSSTATSTTTSSTSTPTSSPSTTPQQEGGDDSSSSNSVALGVGIGLGIPLALALGALIWLYYRRRRRQRDAWTDETAQMSPQQGAAPAYVDIVEMSGQQPVYGRMEDGQVYKQELPVEEQRQELAADKYQ